MKTLLLALLVSISSPAVPVAPGFYETQCHGIILRLLVIDDEGSWIYGPPQDLLEDENAIQFIERVRDLTSRRTQIEVCDGEFV